MIAARKVAPKEEFEGILETSKQFLLENIDYNKNLSPMEFENSVYKTICLKSVNTPFDSQVIKTGLLAFPDIVVSEYYGVEVKKTSGQKFTGMGNSIFEKTRHISVEDIYFMMCKTGGGVDVRWKSYEEGVDDVLITHSPRYAVNLEDDAIPVFSRIGISYNEFRKLRTEEKMGYVRKLRSTSNDNGVKQLWWFLDTPLPLYRFWNDVNLNEQKFLIASIIILCPEIFGDDRTKFGAASIYSLSQGYIIPNMRDLFTAGGKVKIKDKKYPAIFKRVKKLQDIINQQCQEIDSEIFKQFWDIDIDIETNKRWDEWIKRVNHFSSPINILDIF